MKGSLKETESLGTLFGAIADVLERREEILLERITLLENKIEQLEEKIARLEDEYPDKEIHEDEGEELPEIEVELEFDFDDDQVEEQEPLFEQVEDVEEVADDDSVEEIEEDEDLAEDAAGELLEDVAEEFLEDVAGEDDEEELEDKAAGYREEEDEPVLVLDKVRPDWYDWEVDIPGHYIEDIRDGIGLNDKILFMNELFGGSVEEFNQVIDDLNQMHNLVATVEYLRERFPDWDEESDQVYRFYMTVRRRFNKQK